jgi:hypothetical protein
MEEKKINPYLRLGEKW